MRVSKKTEKTSSAKKTQTAKKASDSVLVQAEEETVAIIKTLCKAINDEINSSISKLEISIKESGSGDKDAEIKKLTKKISGIEERLDELCSDISSLKASVELIKREVSSNNDTAKNGVQK